jgi:hypothetical protein
LQGQKAVAVPKSLFEGSQIFIKGKQIDVLQ